MKPTPSELRREKVSELLRGYPRGAAEAADEFLLRGDPALLDRLIGLVLSHYLPPRPDHSPMAEVGANSHLVRDLGLDSVAMVEFAYLLEVIVGFRFSDNELRAMHTLGDLCAAVRRKQPDAPPP